MKLDRKSWAFVAAIVLTIIGVTVGLEAIYFSEIDSIFQSEEKKAAKFKKERGLLALRRAAVFGPIQDPLTSLLGDAKIRSVKTVRLAQDYRREPWFDGDLDRLGCSTSIHDPDLLLEISQILLAGKLRSPEVPDASKSNPYLVKLAVYLEMADGLAIALQFQWPDKTYVAPVHGWINDMHVVGESTLTDKISKWMDKAHRDWGETCPWQRDTRRIKD